MSGKRVLVAIAAAAFCTGVAWNTAAGADAPLDYSTEVHHEISQLPAAPIVPNGVEDLKAIQTRVEAVAKEALPATVAILLDDGQGSGVIVSRDGYVLTAGHVSGKPGQRVMIVLRDGTQLRGKALGANNNIDSGMVKITDKPGKDGFPFVPLGTAKDLKAGQWVVAMGHPGGYREGRPPVVRLGRVLLATHQLLGTDCPLINGDSGGPVFDLDGRLIGINSRIGATTTTNIHVPIDTFEETWDRLTKGEEWGGTSGLLARKWWGGGDGDSIPADGASLGVRGKDLEGTDAGIVITRVKTGTPAERAGLHAGDIVLEMDAKKVESVDALADKVNEHSPGDVVTLTVLRAGNRMRLKATLGAAK